MASVLPSIEFFEGIYEELSNVSLRRDRQTGDRIVLMSFNQLRAIERFQSYTNRFSKALKLTDDEGQIDVQPDSVQFVFGGPEGDDLKRVDCKFAITQNDHWERFMRFMNRYASANGMEYGESQPSQEPSSTTEVS
ncbi:MAG: photosystem II reaction center protein Psb28 [Cyanobacteria bacterium J06627_8]